MILQKYVAALSSIIIVVLSALIAIPSGLLNWTSGLQLAGIGVAAIVTYLAPLLDIRWRGILKTGAAILAAIFAAALPIVNTINDGAPFKPIYIAIIVLAAVNALGVEVGVAIRTDTSAIIGADAVPVSSTVNQAEPNNLSGVTPVAEYNPLAAYFAVGAGEQQPPTALVTTAPIDAVNPANLE